MIVTHVKKKIYNTKSSNIKTCKPKKPKKPNKQKRKPTKKIYIYQNPPKPSLVPVLSLYNSFYFVDLDYTVEIGLGITGGILLVIIIIGTLCYR